LLSLLRTEGILFVGATALALGVVAVARKHQVRQEQIAQLLLAGVVAIVGATAFVLNDRWAASIAQGVTGDITAVDRSPSFFNAIWTGLIRPWSLDNTNASVAMTLVVVTAMAAPVALRVAPRRSVLPCGLLVLGASAAVWAFLTDPSLVTGLLATVPWMVVGLLSLRRSDLTEPLPSFLLLSSLVFTTAVAATSYGIGGAAEWGGRFFHPMIPCLAPIAVVGLLSMRSSVDGAIWRVAVSALAVMTVALSAMALRVNSDARERARTLAEFVETTREPGPGQSVFVISRTRGDGSSRLLWQLNGARLAILDTPSLVLLAPFLDSLPTTVDRVTIGTDADRALLNALLENTQSSQWKLTEWRTHDNVAMEAATIVRSP